MADPFDAAIAGLYDARHELLRLAEASPLDSDVRWEAVAAARAMGGLVEKLDKARALDSAGVGDNINAASGELPCR